MGYNGSSIKYSSFVLLLSLASVDILHQIQLVYPIVVTCIWRYPPPNIARLSYCCHLHLAISSTKYSSFILLLSLASVDILHQIQLVYPIVVTCIWRYPPPNTARLSYCCHLHLAISSTKYSSFFLLVSLASVDILHQI